MKLGDAKLVAAAAAILPLNRRKDFYRVQLAPQAFGLKHADKAYFKNLHTISAFEPNSGIAAIPATNEVTFEDFPVGKSLIWLMTHEFRATKVFSAAINDLRSWAEHMARNSQVHEPNKELYEQTLAVRKVAAELFRHDLAWDLDGLRDLPTDSPNRVLDQADDVRLLMQGHLSLGESRRVGRGPWGYLLAWKGIARRYLLSLDERSKSSPSNPLLSQELYDEGVAVQKKLYDGIPTGREGLIAAERLATSICIGSHPTLARTWPVNIVSALECLAGEKLAQSSLSWLACCLWAPLERKDWRALRVLSRKPTHFDKPWLQANERFLGTPIKTNKPNSLNPFLSSVPDPLWEPAIEFAGHVSSTARLFDKLSRELAAATGFSLSDWLRYCRAHVLLNGFPSEIYDLKRAKLTTASQVVLCYPDLEMSLFELRWRKALCEAFPHCTLLHNLWNPTAESPELGMWGKVQAPPHSLMAETRSHLRAQLQSVRNSANPSISSILGHAIHWANWELYFETSARPVTSQYSPAWVFCRLGAQWVVWLHDKDLAQNIGPRYNAITPDLARSLIKLLVTCLNRLVSDLAQALFAPITDIHGELIGFQVPRTWTTEGVISDFEFSTLVDSLPDSLRTQWRKLPENSTRKGYASRFFAAHDVVGANLGMGHAGIGVGSGGPLSSISLLEQIRPSNLHRDTKLWPDRIIR